MPFTANRIPEKLIALGPIGWFIALVTGHDGHLATIPLAIGGVGGVLGLVLKLTQHRAKEKAV